MRLSQQPCMHKDMHPCMHSQPCIRLYTRTHRHKKKELRAGTRRRWGEQLRRRVAACDCVYVDGGNTFYLRHYMRASGLDAWLPALIREGSPHARQSALVG